MMKRVLPNRITLGISSCLLGAKVRFDGSHKRDKYIVGHLAKYFDFLPICPELSAGLGVPRPAIHLVDNNHNLRVVGTRDSHIDVTEVLTNYSKERVKTLDKISGYILKKDSPTCGMMRVRVYHANGVVQKNGVGVFARALMEKYPNLPVEEEGRLNDPILRENFFERVYLYRSWQELLEKDLSYHAIIEFHTKHKFSLMAHDYQAYQQLGRMVADISEYDLIKFSKKYFSQLMKAYENITSKGRHVNVMYHLYGYLKDKITPVDREELLETFKNYQNGLVPLIVPIAMLQLYFKKCHHAYIAKQSYLEPYPKELVLRNLI